LGAVLGCDERELLWDAMRELLLDAKRELTCVERFEHKVMKIKNKNGKQ